MPHGKTLCSRLIAGGLLLMACFTACAQDARVARLGYAARLSDPLAQSAQQGVELAVEDANAQSLRSRDNWRFELLAQDDRSNANFAVNVARYFIKAGVAGVIGHWSSDSALAVAPLYEQANIPQINFTSTNSQLTAQGYTQIFRMVGGSDDVAATMADVALSSLQSKNLVVIGNASSYSRALSKAFLAQVVERSGLVVSSLFVSRNTADFNAVLKSAIEQNADLIVFSAQFTQAHNFLKSARRLGVKTRILMVGGASNVDFSAEDNGGLYVLEYDVPQENCARWKNFEQRFHARFGAPPSTYARYTYDAATMLAQAVRLTNSTDGQSIAAALRKMHFVGLGGDIEFDAAGKLLKPTYTLYHAQQAQWRVVRFYPAEAHPPVRCN